MFRETREPLSLRSFVSSRAMAKHKAAPFNDGIFPEVPNRGKEETMANANAFQNESQTQTSFKIEGVPNKHVPRESFSRASHFALVLLPVILGVAYTVLKARFAENASVPLELFTWTMRKSVEQDQKTWFFLLVIGQYILGLGSALYVLHLVGRLEDSEKKNS